MFRFQNVKKAKGKAFYFGLALCLSPLEEKLYKSKMYQHVIAHLGSHLKSQQIAQLAMASTSDCSTQLVILSPDSIFGGPTDLRHCCIKILADLNCSPLVFNLRFQYPQSSGSVCFMNNIIIQIGAGATPYLPMASCVQS